MSEAATVTDDFCAAVGHTPLVRLRRASESTGCEILGKAEFMNPGGSVKDRAAKYMILDAEARGVLEPGGTIVEGTAGNTGIGLTLAGASRGYRSVIVIPRTQSTEKKNALRAMGAQLREVDAVPYRDPDNYVHVARRLAESMQADGLSVFYANQWDNRANREGHVLSTGPEIWKQTGGQVDGFICAVGTGGTLAGVADYLKQQRSDIVTAAADPMGAAIYHYVKHGELKSEGSSVSEGIGQGRITGNLEGARIDDAFQIADSDWLPVLFDLVEHEGLYLGGSSGVNVAGAIALARSLGPGHTIVTILCDSGSRYESKLFNPAFLMERDLPVPPWLSRRDSR